MPKMKAVEITASSVAERPERGSRCEGCGADVRNYRRHPVLIGGNCGRCGRCWLPTITWGNPHEIEVDVQIGEAK